MTGQGELLMGMIYTAVEGRDDLDSIVTALQELGRRQGGKQVKPENRKSAASALLWTLRRFPGPAPETTPGFLTPFQTWCEKPSLQQMLFGLSGLVPQSLPLPC